MIMKSVVRNKWAKEEFKNAKVWDKRCIKSLTKMALAIETNQVLSFSAACGETLRQSGSRIFSKNKMGIENILAGHYQQTAKRAACEEIVICPQDTTSTNYSGHKATTGLGPISSSRGSRGTHMHTTMVLREDGLPLGIIGQQQWVRDEKRYGKKQNRKKLKTDDKESHKWIDGLESVNERLSKKIKEIWVVSDRESDVYDYMKSKRNRNIHILLRAVQARNIEVEIEGQKQRSKIAELVNKLPVISTKEIELERENRTERISIAISYSNIKLYPPESKGKSAEPLNMTVIYACEIGFGSKKEKVEWILLCDMQDLTSEKAVKMLYYYTQRWKVERFHFTLKTGAYNVEKLQFDDARTLMNALAFYSIIAWHTLWLTYYGRLNPEAKSNEVIDATEQEVLEAYTGKKITTVLQAVMSIGILGGFLGGSKRYPYPGIKVMWTGLVKLIAKKEGWLLAKSHYLKKYAT